MQNFPARLTVDLKAVAHNVRTVQSLLPKNTQIMSIVKANAYGTGMLEITKTCLENGVSWIGVAKASEAIRLRHLLDEEGLDARIFTWIYAPGARIEELIEARLDISLGALWQVEAVVEAALGQASSRPKVQLEVDTGFGRSGLLPGAEFEKALRLLKRYHDQGVLEFEGVWSHLATADGNDPASKAAVYAQRDQFEAFIKQVEASGLSIKYKHLCASAGIINYPDMHYNMVRPGIVLYGHSPDPESIDVTALGFKPVAKLEAPVVSVKSVPKGTAISYGQRYHTKEDTRIALVPLGYADGISRALSGLDEVSFSGVGTLQAEHLGAPVLAGGTISRIAGRVCMDQFMLDVGRGSLVKPGDWVTLYGFSEGDPKVEEWARCAGTIPYEILTNIPTLAALNYLC